MPASYAKQGPVQEDTRKVSKLYRILTNHYINKNSIISQLPESERDKYTNDLDYITRTELDLTPRSMACYAQGKSTHNDKYLMRLDTYKILERLTDKLMGINFDLPNTELGYTIDQTLTDAFRKKFKRQKELFEIDFSNRRFDASAFKDIF